MFDMTYNSYFTAFEVEEAYLSALSDLHFYRIEEEEGRGREEKRREEKRKQLERVE